MVDDILQKPKPLKYNQFFDINYIKPYKPYILTAPTINPESREGKREWVQRLDGMKNIYFKPARFKQELSERMG
jgi:hypothetical protein